TCVSVLPPSAWEPPAAYGTAYIVERTGIRCKAGMSPAFLAIGRLVRGRAAAGRDEMGALFDAVGERFDVEWDGRLMGGRPITASSRARCAARSGSRLTVSTRSPARSFSWIWRQRTDDTNR